MHCCSDNTNIGQQIVKNDLLVDVYKFEYAVRVEVNEMI